MVRSSNFINYRKIFSKTEKKKTLNVREYINHTEDQHYKNFTSDDVIVANTVELPSLNTFCHTILEAGSDLFKAGIKLEVFVGSRSSARLPLSSLTETWRL